MCGIVGRLNFNNQSVARTEIMAMCRAISHRGPDNQGVLVKGPVGLGNRRLSILDLSADGHQPMTNEDKTVWVSFNGEIYNYKNVKRKLLQKGHKFRSKSDTEVLVHLWEEYGTNFLKYLRGMFAIALWDDKQKILILARDRMGQKPLKYYLDERKIIFGSELKAILKVKQVKLKPDLKAIDQYFGLEAVPAPLTGFKGIKKVPQASFLMVKNGKVSIHQYWQVEFQPKLEKNENELKKVVLDQLTEAVKLRMAADVPVGAFLSGGVDSSAVVALMRNLGQKKIKTFSIGFKEDQYSEIKYARKVAKLVKTDHYEAILKPQSFSLLSKLARIYEEPYGDPSALPTYLVSKLASKKLKVVLTGDGGDDNFAGYQRYQKFASIDTFNRLVPQWSKKILRQLLRPPWPTNNETRILLWELLNERGLNQYATAYLGLQSPEAFKQKLYQKDFFKKIDPLSGQKIILNYKDTKLKPLDNVLLADLNIYLGQVLLPKVDMASMANSLELRSPFLDQKLIQLAAKIPVNLKLKMGTTKYILKKSLEGVLPKEIIYRKKMGFGFPLSEWLKNEWKDEVKNLLLNKRALFKDYFKQQEVEKMFNRFLKQEHYARRLWRLVMFELWLQNYFPR